MNEELKVSAVICNACEGTIMASILPVSADVRKEQAKLLRKYDVRIDVVPNKDVWKKVCTCPDLTTN